MAPLGVNNRELLHNRATSMFSLVIRHMHKRVWRSKPLYVFLLQEYTTFQLLAY